MLVINETTTVQNVALANEILTTIPTSTDYLIIGNSAAGVTAAEHIRAHDAHSSITLVSSEPYAVYGRPLISYLLEGKTDLNHIGFKPQGFYEQHHMLALVGPAFTATKLHAETHEVTLACGATISYGQCLLATGSIPFTPPIEGLDVGALENVTTFITLDDALAARDAIQHAQAQKTNDEPLRVVVIGAGLIGLKAAEALSYYADEVRVLELAPRVLPAVLDTEGAQLLQQALLPHNILCTPGITASKVICEDGRAIAVELTDGSTIACDSIVAAVGVRPASTLAVEAGAAQGRGLIVNERLQTTLPDVYAAGDVTQVTDLLDGSKRPLALWPNAMRQGKIAGLQMAAQRNGYACDELFEGNFAINAVDFFDQSLLTSGIINPAPDSGCKETVVLTDTSYAKFVTREGMLVGYILLNRPANAGIYTSLIEQRIPLNTLDGTIFDEVPLNIDLPADLRWERLHKCYPQNRDRRGWKECE